MDTEQSHPTLMHAEPILAVKNVSETLAYWHDVLGFPGKWTWGEPPTHGGVSWHGVFVQFSEQPKLASVSAGHSIWIRVRNLDQLYAFHREKKAEISSPLENKPWGLAEYTVRDINGYLLRFAAPATYSTQKSEKLGEQIRIVCRKPTADEYLMLTEAVGWGKFADYTYVNSLLAPIIFSVVAENSETGETVGCALLLGDHTSFYYVKDVMVHPRWQRKNVGTAMMQELTNWLEKNGSRHALVGLISGENLSPFYQQFGFSQAFAMIRRIDRK
jgi:GNAT superfamily N-acetyltransferase